ncbi:uncharacterized protein [Clinocottus analis]|uniref:uncharacterized protein n=1 Tax=Clinocottus analis TaxID=304258 RepID=UPI0035C21804
MNLWLSSCFLLAGLFLSSWALTPEECRPLIEPLPLTPSMVSGKSHFLLGYADHEVYKDILKNTESYWVNASVSTSSPDTVDMSTWSKINGSCLSVSVKSTMSGNTGTTSFGNIVSEFHLLPTCEGCLLMSINSTATDLDKLLRAMNINVNITAEKISIQTLYLMAKETTVKDSDLEQFKQQASCLGFTGEPNFIYDPKNDFCAEDEGLKMTDDLLHS